MRKLQEQTLPPISKMTRKELAAELQQLRKQHAQLAENYQTTGDSMHLFMKRADYYYAKAEAYKQALAICRPTKLDAIIKHANEQAVTLYKMYTMGMAFHLIHDRLPFVNDHNNLTDPL